jgi:hypothetical protein
VPFTSNTNAITLFPELEDQMCCFSGGGDSPDRLDAMVYALSDLMLGFQPQTIPICGPVIIEGPARHNPFPVGKNPFSDHYSNADLERCYNGQRCEGFRYGDFDHGCDVDWKTEIRL